MRRKQQRRDERGYVMVVVILVLAVLLSAGLYGIQAMENDLRASNHQRKSEILARAAEAGASHRVSEISLASGDAAAALQTQIVWTDWPANATFDAAYNVDGLTRYAVTSEPLVTTNSKPPAGVQVGRGGQHTVWSVTSHAVGASNVDSGEHAVSVGVKLWSRGGQSYND